MTSPGGGAAAPAAAAPSDPAALLAALMSTDNNVRSQAEVSDDSADPGHSVFFKCRIS